MDLSFGLVASSVWASPAIGLGVGWLINRIDILRLLYLFWLFHVSLPCVLFAGVSILVLVVVATIVIFEAGISLCSLGLCKMFVCRLSSVESSWLVLSHHLWLSAELNFLLAFGMTVGFLHVLWAVLNCFIFVSRISISNNGLSKRWSLSRWLVLGLCWLVSWNIFGLGDTLVWFVGISLHWRSLWNAFEGGARTVSCSDGWPLAYRLFLSRLLISWNVFGLRYAFNLNNSFNWRSLRNAFDWRARIVILVGWTVWWPWLVCYICLSCSHRLSLIYLSFLKGSSIRRSSSWLVNRSLNKLLYWCFWSSFKRWFRAVIVICRSIWWSSFRFFFLKLNSGCTLRVVLESKWWSLPYRPISRRAIPCAFLQSHQSWCACTNNCSTFIQVIHF
mgnify:CR=1 FL=1